MRTLDNDERAAALRRARGCVLGFAGVVMLGACLPKLPVPEPPRDDPKASRAYDFRSKTRIGGEILTIDDVRSDDVAFSGVHVMMKVDHGVVSVHLGPKEFFDSNAVAFEVGDMLDITGIPATYEGSPAVLATKIKKAGHEFVLPERDPLIPLTDGGAPR